MNTVSPNPIILTPMVLPEKDSNFHQIQPSSISNIPQEGKIHRLFSKLCNC